MKFNHIAVLIDAENVSANKMEVVLNKISEYGEIGIKNVYGDFKSNNLIQWDNICLKYVLKQIHTPSLVKGKNSSDIALVIDAMDLLFYGHQNNYFDCFCIVSSDSDFSGLAKYIRQKNCSVIGIGKQDSVESFKMACDLFIPIEKNQNNSNTTTTQKTEQKPAEKPIEKAINRYTANQLKCDTKLLTALKTIIKECLEDDWANYGTVNLNLHKNYPNLKPAQYGYANWRELIEHIDLFEVKSKENGIFVREKTKESNTKTNQNTPKKQATKQWTPDKLKQDKNLIKAIKNSISNHINKDGWTDFSYFNTHINANYSSLSPNHYGYGKWRSLINQIDLFEFKNVGKTLFIREKNHQTTNKENKKLDNQKLLDDILSIINDNKKRPDEWIHISILGSQLKQKGYNAKDFGYKTITLLLRNLKGVKNKIVNNTDYFTLTDKSKIKPIAKTESNQQPIEQPLDFKETALYRLLLRNQEKLNTEINKLLLQKSPLKLNDFWLMLEKQLPADYLLANNQSYPCFVQFFKHQLPAYQLIDDDGHLLIFGKE